jgi:uncharacterized membrane protein
MILALLAIALISEPAATVQGQTTAHLTMTITGQNLTSGFNNTVTITLVNNYYSSIYDTDIVVSIPSALSLVGDNHWHYDSISLGQSVTIVLHIYAPTAAIGSTYLGSLTATYKQLGDVSSTQESHALSFSVYGWINLIVYSIQLTPSTTTPGGNATVSGNLLNSGNLAAYNTNVTVQSQALAPTSSSSVFVGEVDPNIPRPFSLLIVFKSDLAPGNYSIMVRVSAVDTSRPTVPLITQKGTQIQIRRATPQLPTQRQTGSGLVEAIYAILRDLYNALLGSLTGILTPLEWFKRSSLGITITATP